MQLWKGILSQLWYIFVGRCSYFMNRKRWACPFGIRLHQSIVWMHSYLFQSAHWSLVRPAILHVLSHVWLHQNTFGACLFTRIWRSLRLRQLMGQETENAFATCNYRNWSYRWTDAIVCESLGPQGLEWPKHDLTALTLSPASWRQEKSLWGQ